MVSRLQTRDTADCKSALRALRMDVCGLITFSPDFVKNFIQLIHHGNRRIDAVKKFIQILPLELLALRILPRLLRFLPMNRQLFRHRGKTCSVGAETHGFFWKGVETTDEHGWTRIWGRNIEHPTSNIEC